MESGLLVGAMLPYWFSAMTMKSVGMAGTISLAGLVYSSDSFTRLFFYSPIYLYPLALAMVNEVRRQIREKPGILTGETEPEYENCIAISTSASLREMIPPGALVMISPLAVGFLFGSKVSTMCL